MNREVLDAQKTYCDERKVPMFTPTDGRCFRCGQDITDALTVERASKELITGCPLCHRSYVD